jgi:hypothetical protein
MLAALLLLAIAQTEEEPGGARVELERTVPVPTASAAVGQCPPQAEQLYEDAVEDLSSGNSDAAYSQLTRVLELCPSHPYAKEMARVALLMPPKRPDQKTRSEDDESDTKVELAGEQPTLLARGELISVQTLHGLLDGLLICAAVECNDGRAVVGLGFLGLLAGGGLSFALSDGITSGQALAVNSGTAWGIWHGIAVNAMLEPQGETVAGIMLGMNLAGTALGTATAAFLKPKNGQVSFANSAGLWSTTLTLFVMNAAGVNIFEDDGFWQASLLASDLGLLAGALGATQLDISRGRVLLIDAGGVVGMFLGMGVAVLAAEEPSQELVGALGTLGILGGLTSVYFLSAGIDEPDDSGASVMFMPGGPRGTWGGTLGMVF